MDFYESSPRENSTNEIRVYSQENYYKLIRKFSESLGLNRLPYSGVLAINSHQMNKESNQMIFTSHVSLSFENCLDLFLN